MGNQEAQILHVNPYNVCGGTNGSDKMFATIVSSELHCSLVDGNVVGG